MFNCRTLFVLGAGASFEVGLPIGVNLARDIAERLNIYIEDYRELKSGDRHLLQAFRYEARKKQGNANPYISAAWQIRDGMPLSKSIDGFMDNHKHDENIQFCGKLAIVRSIGEAERNSLLYSDQGERSFPKNDQLANTWFFKFFRILNEGVAKSAIDTLFDRVSFITFNYDRSLEHFLLHAVQGAYAVTEGEAQQVVARARIFHPYGVIGALPWQAHEGVPFGEVDFQPDSLISLSRGIRTYTERMEEGDTLNAIRKEVEQADRIVFLGFAFHPQNMMLLTPRTSGPIKSTAVYAFATALKMSHEDRDVVTSQIAGLLDQVTNGRAIYVRNDLTCSDLFDTYSRTFSMS
jgi:hypothetical protein